MIPHIFVAFFTFVGDAITGLIPMQIPNPDPEAPPGTGGVRTILSWLKWIGYSVVGGAIIIGGTLIAVQLRRGEGSDALPKILWPMAGAIVIGGGVGMITTLIGA